MFNPFRIQKKIREALEMATDPRVIPRIVAASLLRVFDIFLILFGAMLTAFVVLWVVFGAQLWGVLAVIFLAVFLSIFLIRSVLAYFIKKAVTRIMAELSSRMHMNNQARP